MKYYLATMGLAPLIITQAAYVRFVTPRLPEPPGERSGVEGLGPPLNLLILGDSAAAGVGVSAQSQALSGQLVAGLARHFRTSWTVMAQSGYKAKDVVTRLKEALPEPFDVVVTSIGVNDVTHATRSPQWIDQLGQMVDLLKTKFHSQHILLTSVPPMHLFPALPQPLRWYLGLRAKRFNGFLETLTDECRLCEFINIHFPLETAYLAADGFHPGAAAYSIWAGHVADIIQRRLSFRTIR